MPPSIDLKRLIAEVSVVFKQDIENIFVLDTEKAAKKLIEKLHALITKLLVVAYDEEAKSDAITIKSLNVLQSKLDSNIDVQFLQRKILQLYLVLLEREFQVTSPPLGSFTEIRRDKPIVTPGNIFKASLADKLYSQLEAEIKKPTLSLSSEQSLGRLALWLFLKEGCVNTKDISALITNSQDLYRTEQLSYFSGKQQYFLSPVAEALLVLHRISFINMKHYGQSRLLIQKAILYQHEYSLTAPTLVPKLTSLRSLAGLTSSKIMCCINDYCHHTAAIPKQYSLNLSDIRQCHRIETVLTQSPIDFRIQSSLLQSTPLTRSTMKRVFLYKTDVFRKPPARLTNQAATVRQSTAWKKNHTSYNNITELSSDELVRMLHGFLDLLKTSKNTRKEQAHQGRLIRRGLFEWLEAENNASKYPVVWVLVSWMYQLLYRGDIGKKVLTFSTIRDYVRTFAVPFIAEFNYCNLFTMDALEWAEKLNIVAEGINSTKRKSFVLYFADFVVSSQIVPELCFSDLDITTSKSNVSANLITMHEADAVTSFLNKDSLEAELALVVFLLGFYGGLRRGEIGGLQLNDFHLNDHGYLQVHIRLNKYRSLKTGNSARNLPLDCLMPIHWQKKLISFIEKSKLSSQKTNALIFQDSKRLKNAFTLLTVVLKEITQDDKLRFHHLRHSFANWNWLLINFNRYPTNNLPLPLQHNFFSADRQNQLFHRLGMCTNTRKKAFALSRLLGHGTIETTFSSYIHLAALHIYLLNRRRNESPLHLLQYSIDYTVKLDNKSMRPIRNGKPLALYHDALPMTMVGKSKPNLERSLELLINKQERIPSSNRVPIADVCKCISLLSYGYSIKQAAELTKISTQLITRIALRLESHGEIYTRRSKNTLPEFCGINRLNQYQIDQLNFFMQQFDKSLQSEALRNAKINLAQVTKALHHCVGAKGHLVRTHDIKTVAFLLKTMKVIGIKDEHVRIKWHFSHKLASDEITIDKVISHYRYWEQLVQSRVGFNATTIEAVIPHRYDRLSQKMTAIGVDIHRSDEAKFLGYHAKGNISIHLLQTKKENRDSLTREFRKQVPMSPQRSRSYITFLQLLDVYLDVIPLPLNID